MLNKILIFSVLPSFLISCWAEEVQIPPPVVVQHKEITEVKLQSGQISVFWKILDSSGTQGNNSQIDKQINEVAQSKDMVALEKIVPITSGIDQTYFEMQKNQTLLTLESTKIQDQWYLLARKQYQDIIMWKEIWPDSLKTLETTYMQSVRAQSSDMNVKKIVFATALRDFQKSEEYLSYNSGSTETRKQLQETMRKYYTPEMRAIDAKIKALVQSGSLAPVKQ